NHSLRQPHPGRSLTWWTPTLLRMRPAARARFRLTCLLGGVELFPVRVRELFYLLLALIRDVRRPHDEAVGLADLVIGDEPLEVPRRALAGGAAPVGRLGEPHAVPRAKHRYEGPAAANAVVPRLGVGVLGPAAHEGQREVAVQPEVRQGAGRRMGRLFTVGG